MSNDFDGDLVRLTQIQQAAERNSDCDFLLGFIDKLWREYMTALDRASEPPPDCPLLHEPQMKLGRKFCCECGTALTKPAAKAELPPAGCEEWWHLKPYGYAPGGYTMKCPHCKTHVFSCDKRASACKPCATALYESAMRQAAETGESHGQ